MPVVAIILLLKSNKFFVKPKSNKVLTNPSSIKGFDDGQGTGGISRKANKEILEYDRKRQIELKLIVLEDKLVDQGYTDAEIADKLQEARQMLEASAASEEAGGPAAIIVGDEKSLCQITAEKKDELLQTGHLFFYNGAVPSGLILKASEN